jgi:alpha-L-fucosidase 2
VSVKEFELSETENSHGMTMRYPATRWQDALPTGSGVVGALVYGNIQNDTIVLNHDALFYPNERPISVNVSDQLPEVRRLIQEGKCRDAARLMPEAYAERSGAEPGSTSTGRDPYQPFCAIQLAMSTDGPFRKYRRGVDFGTGRAWVEWTDDSTTMTREVFVSRVTDTVLLRIRGNRPGAVSCRLGLGKACNEQIGQALTHTGALPGDVALSVSQEVSQADQALTFLASYPDGFSFGAVGRVDAPGGTLSVTDDALVIEGADEVVLQVRLWLGERNDDAITPADFDATFAEHAALHAELFRRVTLSLGQEPRLSNEAMLMAAYDGDVPLSLVQTMFEFGRYLLICSSRPGGLPANLQGLWNGDYAPAWNSDVHTDENIQMNYWQAMPGDLGEAALPLFDYFEKFIDDFRANAKDVFGCRGVLVPIAMTTHGQEIPCTWSNWTAAAGWIGQHFYDYYLFTGDVTFLKDRAVPWLMEVAYFYEDFLQEDDDGKLRFAPSLSPENRPTGSNSLLCINATMDVAICREVLANLCDGCEQLGIDEEGVARWRSMLEKLPAYEINEDGAMKEWLHPDFKDRYHHRHQSQVYPVFPGLEVTEESDPEIYEACRVAVEKRLVIGLTSQTGWSMAHMANIYARLGQGDRALDCLDILTRSSTGPNLFTYHNDWRQMALSCGGDDMPPFQIDANFGITAAVLEMLVFSKLGLVKLLPALPEKWSSGKVTGIRCRGGITVAMAWDVEAGSFSATLTSTRDQELRLRLPEWVGEVDSDPVGAVVQEAAPGYCSAALSAGTSLRITTG